MAIKARLNVRKPEFGIWLWVLIIAMVAFVMFLFEPFIGILPDNMKAPVTYIIYVVYMIGFLYLLVYTSLWYSMVLSHHDLAIQRHFWFFHSKPVSLECKYFTGIVHADRYNGQAKPKNYTIMKIDGFGKYVLTYTEKGEEKAAKIQCTRRFHDHIVELIELNQRQAANQEKKKAKENKKDKKKKA